MTPTPTSFEKMAFRILGLQAAKQLGVLLLWVVFVGWALWYQHAQQSQQPPLYDAWGYYFKAYNFWTKAHEAGSFNPFDVEPSFRPPGTVLMSYPFGFDVDFRGFYFRSIFVPIALLGLAVVIGGYRRALDNRSKWLLVVLAAFLSTLPGFYYFELSPGIPAPHYWGLVDHFLAGVAALAAAAAIRSVWTHSLAWTGLAAALASFCLLIKPSGLLIMMLIGLTWFGLTALRLKSVWQSAGERKSATRLLLGGMAIFAITYLAVLAGSFSSQYLSSKNLAYGAVIVGVLQMETESLVSWPVFRDVVRTGLGYPFAAWLCLMIVAVGHHLWRSATGSLPWPRPVLAGLTIASSITFAVGVWFWIVATGGITQIRYFMPFALTAVILALPAILTAVRALPGWALTTLSLLMLAPVVNMGALLAQRNAPIAWQEWTGVNLTSGVSRPVVDQAWNFAATVKRDGRNVNLYSMTMNFADATFQSVVVNALIATPPMPLVSIQRPQDGQRPITAYRKAEMLDADYWLFEPVRDPARAAAALAIVSIDAYDQEKALFQAWATQLTENDGVAVVSDTPTARVLRVVDPVLLEKAFDALLAKHHWRSTFLAANPKRRFDEKELAAALAQYPPSLTNVNFADRFHLRALSVSRAGDETTVRLWWKPLSPLPEHDWALFIHSIDDEGKILLANHVSVVFDRSLSSSDGTVLFEQLTFKNPAGSRKLAIGFVRPNQPLPVADKGTRDWDGRRVIVPLP